MESTSFWNPESSTQDPESTAWNPESKTVLDSLTWGENQSQVRYVAIHQGALTPVVQVIHQPFMEVSTNTYSL